MSKPATDVEYVEICGYYGYYAGSDGNIYSVIDSVIEDGKRRVTVERVKKYTSGNYDTVSLLGKDMRYATVNVHTLICAAFKGKPPSPDTQIRHINGNSHDNRAENLEYGTPRENWYDKYSVGTATVGEKNPNAKLSDKQRREVCELYELGYKQIAIAALYGITQGAVSKILRKGRYLMAG